MAGALGRGWELIVHSMNVFKAYPSFLLPIFAVWGFYVPEVLYLKYYYKWKLHSNLENAEIAFLSVFALSFLILMSCSVVLEMIKQIEEEKPSLIRAIAKAIGKDMFKILPLSIIWAIIWFILNIIQALLRRKDGDSQDDYTLTAESAALTIANYNKFSLSEAFIDALKKGVRMVMFLIMPALVWEDLDLVKAIKKGFAVLRAHLGDFAGGYALTYAAAGIVFLPVAIIFELGTRKHGHPPLINFPDYVWVGTIIYMGMAWSFCIYLEQMFMAQLYLWHMKWETEVEKAKKENQPIPEFASVKRPELLTKTPGLFV